MGLHNNFINSYPRLNYSFTLLRLFCEKFNLQFIHEKTSNLPVGRCCSYNGIMQKKITMIHRPIQHLHILLWLRLLIRRC